MTNLVLLTRPYFLTLLFGQVSLTMVNVLILLIVVSHNAPPRLFQAVLKQLNSI
jgi:hypothetical protein